MSHDFILSLYDLHVIFKFKMYMIVQCHPVLTRNATVSESLYYILVAFAIVTDTNLKGERNEKKVVLWVDPSSLTHDNKSIYMFILTYKEQSKHEQNDNINRINEIYLLFTNIKLTKAQLSLSFRHAM